MRVNRKQSHFYFMCEQHLAESLNWSKDAYGNAIPNQPCDSPGCPLIADFEWFPGLVFRTRYKKKDWVKLEDWK